MADLTQKVSDRDLLALPVHLGGLGIIDPCHQSTVNNSMSEEITASLVALILQQSQAYTPEAKAEQLRAKRCCTFFVDNDSENQRMPLNSRTGFPETCKRS